MTLRFLRRLAGQIRRKVFLVVDRHPAHRSAAARNWLARHYQRVELFFLPGYSPGLNPGEMLNHDVQVNAVGWKRPRNQRQLTWTVRNHRDDRRRKAHVVRREAPSPMSLGKQRLAGCSPPLCRCIGVHGKEIAANPLPRSRR